MVKRLIQKTKDEFGMIAGAEDVELPEELDDESAEFFDARLRYQLERAEAEEARFANLPNLLAVTISIAVAANIAFLVQKDLPSWIAVVAGLAILLHVAALFGILLAIFFLRHRDPWLEVTDLLRPAKQVRRDTIVVAYRCTQEYIRRRGIRWLAMLSAFFLFTIGLVLLVVGILGMIIS